MLMVVTSCYQTVKNKLNLSRSFFIDAFTVISIVK